MKYGVILLLVAIILLVGIASADTLIVNEAAYSYTLGVGDKNAVYSTVRTTTGASGDTWLYTYLSTTANTNNYRFLSRAGITWNTSALPDVCTITGVELDVNVYLVNSALGNFNVDVTDFNPVNSRSYTYADGTYTNWGETAFATIPQDTAGTGWENFTLSSAAFTNINKTGDTVFGLRYANDTSGVAPAWLNTKISQFWIYNHAAASGYKPILQITYNTAVAPVASFTTSKTFLRIPNSVTVTDTSTNTPTSWQWSWGDGSSNSTTQNPTHQYLKRGKWDIILTATNAGGSGTTAATLVRVAGYENYT